MAVRAAAVAAQAAADLTAATQQTRRQAFRKEAANSYDEDNCSD